MSSRIFWNGRTIILDPKDDRLWRAKVAEAQAEAYSDRYLPIPPDSPRTPFREGEAWQDPETGITFRVLSRLTTRDGWGVLGFWLARYECTMEDLRALVDRGFLDAAMESGSAVRRLRCRDEVRVLDWLRIRYPRRRNHIRR